MSWDSVFELKQVRQGIVVPLVPPVVIYIWYLCDLILPGPGGMLLLQDGILMVAIGMLLYVLRTSLLLSMSLLLLFAATPVILGPMLVVWKDVGMSAFLAFAVALIAVSEVRQRLWPLYLAIVFLVVGGCYRFNAFPALLPIGFAALLVMRERLWPGDVGGHWKTTILVYVLGLVLAFAIIVASISVRLPDFKPLHLPTTTSYTQVFDLLAISVCVHKNLIPGEFFLRDLSVDDLARIYRPEDVQLAFKDGNPAMLQYRGFVANRELSRRWLEAVSSHPWCYFQHRFRVLSYLIGANGQAVFYITDPGILPNDLGITFDPSHLTTMVVSYVAGASKPGIGLSNILARAWLWWSAATIALAILYVRKQSIFRLAALLYVSGVLYMLGMFFVAPAADARYCHWFVVACYLVVAISILNLAGARKSSPQCPQPR